ncbi:MAG: Phosphatidylglycerophosphatase A [Chloroflexota bacterium]|nr:phosphatidylglycerophosphatase A [Dehalococcoidia bacterium]MQG52476.1 phosphatidylglycerophosphatase A [SAR202 cluster bacterium]CAI8286586.1 MAG: Phosphatidylglycerophosphatase A [Chloroflexota bacterium]
MKTKFSYLYTSSLGIGFVPFASGTWGSLVGAITYFILLSYISLPAMICITVLGVATAIVASNHVIPDKTSDPKHIVIDEVLGMWVTCLFMPLSSGIGWYILAFVLFRILDITKIPPINSLEKLHGGIGIVFDDLAAGVIGGLILLVISLTLTTS